MTGLPGPDLLALLFFTALLCGYSTAIRKFAHHSINAQLGGLRVAWMRTMLRRENRIVDSALIGHVVHSASFFASTSLIVIGAILSLLSNVEHLQPAIESLAFVPTTSRTLFELKIVLPLAVMVIGFVKFTWSIRQLNYTIALIGAAPDRHSVADFEEALAASIGDVMSAALGSFNDGMRSYYYAIAGLAWLVGPWEMAVAAVILTAMLVWRQVNSPAAHAFQRALDATDAAQQAIIAARMQR